MNCVYFFATENEDTKHHTLQYIDVLADLLYYYNHSYHRSIKMAPAVVSVENQEHVFQTLYTLPKHGTKRNYYKECDHVGVAQVRKNFRKRYLANWTEKLFTVSSWLRTNPITYTLKDDLGEELCGVLPQRNTESL